MWNLFAAKRLSVFGILSAFALLSRLKHVVRAEEPKQEPLKTEKDPKNLELKVVQVITRHGWRTPNSIVKGSLQSLPWECDPINFPYPGLYIRHRSYETVTPYEDYRTERLTGRPLTHGNCFGGQLTQLGRQQMTKLGDFLRKRYVHELNFMPTVLEPSQIYIRSTDTLRTIETAYALTLGLYPFTERPQNAEIVVDIAKREEENMYPRSACLRFTQMRQIRHKSERFRNHRDLYHQIWENIENEEERRYWESRSWAGCYSSISSLLAHGFPLPADLDSSVASFLRSESGREYLEKFSETESSRIGIGRFIRDLNDHMILAIEDESSPKFQIFSGHDNTVGPLLNAFKVFDGLHPDMGSFIVIEVWKDKAADEFYVKMFYQEKLVKLEKCQDSLCRLEEFLDVSKELIPENYEQECLVKEM